jgi:oligoendopeptidase F
MFNPLPQTALDFMDWRWSQIEPYYHELSIRSLDESSIDGWLLDWTRLNLLLYETHERLMVATTVDTTDQEAKRRYQSFLDEILPPSEAAEQKLKEVLLASGIEPDGFEIPLRNMRAEADLFRQENLPLLSEELKMITEYDKITGAQTVEWESEEITIRQLLPVLQDENRDRRERAWQLSIARQMDDREAINQLWGRFLALRLQLAENAGMPDYRRYRWQQLLRFDYTPEDCLQFHKAIEDVVVPVASRLYEKRRSRLGLDLLRPWDLDVDPRGFTPLRPFETVDELERKTAAIFNQVDPQLGAYFEVMRQENLLDLDNRKGKATGGYCSDFPVAKRPFIFTNAVGLDDDVRTMLHEGGHAFHFFEMIHLPYFQQLNIPMEFAEVASTSMEFLSYPYLMEEEGGFYNTRDGARACLEHLERSLRFWPYMAVVDAFQHWVYENPEAAAKPINCDTKWGELWDRFMVGQDWSGLEEEKMTGWHRKLHIHQDPFYYVEYGLAQLGAVQIWRNALADQTAAVSAYRRALSLGGTVTLPELYAAAGVKFAFDSTTLKQAVELMEGKIEAYEALLE